MTTLLDEVTTSIEIKEKHFKGVFTYVAKDNSHYEGQWEQNKARGIGRFQDPSGEYLGEWLDGEKHGLGIEKWNEDGTVFKGTYKKGLKEGEGVYIWGDGSSYEGQLKDNQVCCIYIYYIEINSIEGVKISIPRSICAVKVRSFRGHSAVFLRSFCGQTKNRQNDRRMTAK